MGARAGIVVTGTEVLTGRVPDRNGPWLAEQLRVAGVDIAQIVTVGDRTPDLVAALRFLAEAGIDLIITTGGLGPTADDLTAEVVADFQGRALRLDRQLEAQIATILEHLTAGRGWQLNPEATAAGTRKQAMVPDGSAVLTPVGTAPGLVVPAADGRAGPPVLVLPGPPRELQGMWPAALADATVRAALAGSGELRQNTLRLWGTPESELAATLRRLGDQLSGLEVTTCLRDGELEIVTRYEPSAQPAYDALAAQVAADYPRTLFSPDGRTVDEIVADTLLARGLTVGTGESCTAGLFAGRLADRPGSSAYLLGGLVTYSNQAKHDLLGVPTDLIERVGAVSAEVADAMAAGARERLGSDIGVGITGIAGPDGGTEAKPVGLVHFCASNARHSIAQHELLPGGRADVRRRAVEIALHLVRRLLDA